MNNKLKFIKIFLLTGILLPLVLAVLGYYFVIPRVVDFDKYKTQIRSILNRRIVYPFDLGKLDIKLTWDLRARISADSINIKKHDESKFLKAGDSYVEVALLPLLDNRVILKKIRLNTFDAKITRLENGEFDLKDILATPEKPKYKVSLKNTDIILNGYNINFLEKYVLPAKEYVFTGKKVKVKNFKPGRFIEVYALGRAVFKDRPDAIFDVSFSSALPVFKKEKLRLKGKITNLEPDVLIPYINSLSDAEFTSLAKKGNVKFDLEFSEKIIGKNNFFIESTFNDINVKTVKKGVISSHKGKINLKGKGHYNNSLIFFDNFELKAKNVDLKSSGEIKHYKDKSRDRFIELKLVLVQTKAEILAHLFPKVFKMKRNHFENILKHKIKADLNCSMVIKGYSSAPNIFGALLYNNLYMFGDSKNTSAASGKIDFLGPAMVVKNKIFTGKDDFISVIGRIDPFREKTLNLDITSGEVDFARTRRVLFALRDFFKISLGPVVEMNFKGRGRANLNIAGKFKDIKLNGYIQGNSIEVKYAALSRPIRNLRGKIRFVDKKVHYDEITGYVEGQKVFPAGYTDLYGYTDAVIHLPQLELDKALEVVNTSPLLIGAKSALKDIIEVAGKADTKIKIKGFPKDIESDGKFIVNSASVLYKGFGGRFENIKGPVEFKREDIFFKGATAEVKGSPVTVSGFIRKTLDTQLKISSDSINLDAARIFLTDSSILEQANKILEEYTQISGVSAVELNLEGNLNAEPFKNLVFKKMNASFNHIRIGIPVAMQGGVLEVTPDKLNAYDVAGSSEEIDFKINGTISNLKAYIEEEKPLVPDFALQIDKFDLSRAKNFSEIPLLPDKIREFLSNFDEFHGTMKVSVKAEPDNIAVQVLPDNISAVYKPYDTFVLIQEGKAEFSGNNIEISSLKGVFSESTFNINAFIKNYKQEAEFDFSLKTDVNFNDVNKLRFYSDIPVQAGGIIPFTLAIKGDIKNWSVFGRMILEKGSFLNYITDIGLPRDKVRLITLEAKGSNDKLNVDRLRIDMSDSAEKLVNINDRSKEYEGFINLINIQGEIDKIKSKNPLFRDFIIKTNDENSISTKLFNPSIGCLLDNGCQNFFSRGDFKTNLTLNGYIASPEVQGSTTFQDIIIPDYNTKIESISLIFEKKAINLYISGLNIGESKMNVAALIDSKFETPVLIKNLRIDSGLFNADELIRTFTGNYVRNSSELPPFVITGGSLVADELIIRDLITSDVKATFNFTPDWLLTVSKLELLAAGGKGTGNIFLNFNTNEVSANFDVLQMQANALATTLLTIPNELYGTLDGSLKFSTRGKNYEELIANSNGYAEFQATKGRFVRLGSLEYFLRAVNVAQSGLGGLNLNNIIDLVAPKKTGHFETLRGKIYVKDGILYTDDITSSGKFLSLYISGKLDMLTNNADVQVLGRLSKKVSGLLGPVGSISINQFIDYMPGLGFLPATPGRKGVIELIPGLSKIPGLELANDRKFRRFAVQINGDLYNQESVKSFRWIE